MTNRENLKPGASSLTSSSSIASTSTAQQQNNDSSKPINGNSKPTVYELNPPQWRPRLHPGSRAIGAPDIYIRRSNEPGPPEDELSENNVRNGLHARPAVGNETFSAHDMIYDRLKGKSVVNQLGQLFDEIVQRRQQLAGLRCGPSASQYRQPQRVTLNEVKLAAYVKELADPSVPIRKLARSVPHGYRGERMLDMLWNGGSLSGAMAAVKFQPNSNINNNGNPNAKYNHQNGLQSVEISRAVWFVRVVGASEISSSRLRQGNSAQYTSEWTGILMGWLRRQIVELNIAHHHNHSAESPATGSSPMTQRNRQAVSTPQRSEEPYALILEDDFRDRWIAKWSYSLALLRALTAEGLVDCQVAARVSIDMFRTANVVQLFISLALLQEYLDVISNSITLSHFALDVLSAKLKDYDESAAGRTMSSSTVIRSEIKAMILYLFDSRPESFVGPSCWTQLSPIINSARKDTGAKATLDLITERNEKLSSGLLDLNTLAYDRSNDFSRLKNIQILDQIAQEKDIQTTFEKYFGRNSESNTEKVRALLIWSTTEFRFGFHRPFAAARLLEIYTRLQPSRSQKRGVQKLKDGKRIVLDRIDLDAIIMSWITDVDLAMKRREQNGSDSGNTIRWDGILQTSSFASMVILIGEMCRLGCFSFQKYLQRLTARGLTAMGGRELRSGSEGMVASNGMNGQHAETPTSDSIPSKLLRSIPLINPSVPLEHQRRLAIYGNRAKESWEEAMERRALRELGTAFTWLGEMKPMDPNLDQENFSLDDLHRFWASSRYIRSRIVNLHLLPNFKEYARQQELRDYQFIQMANLLVRAEEFAALSEILLEIHKNAEIFVASIRHLAKAYTIEHSLIWLCMDSPLAEYTDMTSEFVPILPLNSITKTELLETLQSSYGAFREGQETQAVDFAINQYVAPYVLLSMLESTSETSPFFIEWASGTLPKTDAAVDKWIDDLNAYVMKGSISDEQSNVLIKLCVALICVDLNPHNWKKILVRICLPALSSDLSNGIGVITQHVQFTHSLLAAFFLHQDLSIKQRVEVKAIRSRWMDTEFASILLQIVCALKSAEQNINDLTISTQIVRVREAICQESFFAFYVQTNLMDAVDLIRSNISGQDIHVILQSILPLCWPWSSDEDLISGAAKIFLNLDQWRWNQMLCEVSITINSLNNKGIPSDSGSGAERFSNLAFLFSENVFSKVDTACSTYAISTLVESPLMNGAQFFVSLVNERLKLLNKQLEATFTNESTLKAELEKLLRLLQGNKTLIIAASGPSVQSMRLVSEWLEGNIPFTPVNEISTNGEVQSNINDQTNESGEELATRLGIICFLLKLDSILNNLTIKAIAPRLFCAIIHFALSFSRKPDRREENIEVILDVAQYLLQQAPADLQQSMRGRAMDQIGTSLSIRPCPLDRIGSTINLLICGDSTSNGSSLISALNGQKGSLIEAHSTTSALLDGQFTAVQIKPWDLHPNVEAVQIMGTKTTDSTTNGYHHHSNVSVTGMTSLSNNGPLSLHHFGAFRTLDRLPERTPLAREQSVVHTEAGTSVPTTLVSEQSYGLHLGGQPIYARDAKRGLLSLHPNRSDGGDGEKLSADDLKVLVPALCVKVEKSKSGSKTANISAKSTLQADSAKNEKDAKAAKDNANGIKKKNEKTGAKSTSSVTTKAEKKSSSSTNKAIPAAGSKKRKTPNAPANESKSSKSSTPASRKRAKK